MTGHHLTRHLTRPVEFLSSAAPCPTLPPHYFVVLGQVGRGGPADPPLFSGQVGSGRVRSFPRKYEDLAFWPIPARPDPFKQGGVLLMSAGCKTGGSLTQKGGFHG